MRMPGRFIIGALASAAAVFIIVFIFRFQILQLSADAAIRKILPAYVIIDKISFEPLESRILLAGFKILNPDGFSTKYLLEIDKITCAYKMKGKSIIDGFEVIEPVLSKAVFNIERLEGGALNLIEMQSVINANSAAWGGAEQNKDASGPGRKNMGGVKISDIIKLPERFRIENGRILFLDRMNAPGPHMITIENIESGIAVKLDEFYEKLLRLDSEGNGNIGGRKDEVVRWAASWNPGAPRLTMSSRFEVRGVTIKTFEPYYDRYSPFVFSRGRFSGEMVFDFDNGSIGSMNEIRLTGLEFSVKPGYENALFWETTVPDLMKYFTSASGEIVFDFKIKGDMASPKFFLGPISKQAIASLAIEKISQVVSNVSESQGNSGDIQKVKEYIDIFKGFIDKR